MMEEFFDDNDLSHPNHHIDERCSDILLELKSGPKSVDMCDIFKHETYVVYQKIKYPTDFDLEQAEYIFAQYECMEEYQPSFGREWWKLESDIEKIILKIVGILAWDCDD
jgi:hypothetical protein